MKTTSCRSALRGKSTGLLLAALTLAGCSAMPIGTMDPAEVTSAGAQAQTDLFFRPGAADLLPGEAARVNALLHSLVLRAEDDVVIVFGATGSDVLDARRVAEVRRDLRPGPARLRIARPLGFARVPDRPDIALVQVRRYDRVLITCPGSGRTNENVTFAQPIPTEACANPVNIAEMAVDKRDLTAPRRLEGSSAITAATAVETYRAGKVVVTPVGQTSN